MAEGKKRCLKQLSVEASTRLDWKRERVGVGGCGFPDNSESEESPGSRKTKLAG